jgi:LemA protein
MGTLGLAMLVAMGVSGCGYSEMVEMKERVDASWAQVENQLRRRNEIIPGLLDVTKGYAGQERDVLDRVADARAKLLAGGTREERIGAATELTGALGGLMALAERYPALKANAQFVRLAADLGAAESAIGAERSRYNEAVRAYNAFVREMPRALYAGSFGFPPARPFEVPADARRAPKADVAASPPGR